MKLIFEKKIKLKKGSTVVYDGEIGNYKIKSHFSRILKSPKLGTLRNQKQNEISKK